MSNDKVKFSSQLAENIWGHRFKDGQRGNEYTLEFLNVMAGTDYKLGAHYYSRKKMTNFRSFVFEGSKEGAKNKDGSHNFVEFSNVEKEKLIQTLGIDEADLGDLQQFFRNLKIQITTPSGKEADRSWYASMLFPLHESLLFFELRTNKKTNSIAFERNFFARGGELYYLMLTYGTKDNLQLREEIELRLRDIMRQNKSVTDIVDRICENLDDYSIKDKRNQNVAPLIKDKSLEGIISGWQEKEYPSLPIETESFTLFKDFAIELHALLHLDIDLYEMFSLLTSMISFQIHRYMIYRAEETNNVKNHYFFDCLDGQDIHIKRLAQDSYNAHERSVRESFESFMNEHLQGLIPKGHEIELLKKWKVAAKNSSEKKEIDRYEQFLIDINFNSAHAPKKKSLISAIEIIDENQAIKTLKNKIVNYSLDELTKKQLPIIRTLARDGGFVAMGTGIRSRYILTDTFLSSLVYATLGSQEKMEFHEFMEQLFNKFDIVIGTEEAKKSGIYEKEGVNLKYFHNNEKKLRQKLKQNGLLQEYSDATALIQNPYYRVGGN